MKQIHFIGIGGSGLSAIAGLLVEMGFTVTGSDCADTSFLPHLRAAGVTIQVGHRPENIRGADVVVRSSAIPDDNPEVVAAHLAGIPVLKRADFLGELMAGKTGIAVAGTHGKTTTTAMLAWVLYSLKQDPSFIIGGMSNNFGVNAHVGKGKHFVIEADEYDRMFLGLKPVVEVVTNIEHDHPDYYPTPEDFKAAFVEFLKLLPVNGILIACVEDRGSNALISEAKQLGMQALGYGISKKSKLIDNQSYVKTRKGNEKGGFMFEAIVNGQSTIVDLAVPGDHNVRNALATLTVVSVLGLPVADAAKALSEFSGTGRRFDVLGEVNGITIINDYAHHPTEIRATLAAARLKYANRRIWVVWQPHTYSRTQALFSEFARAFPNADEVIVTEIFPAREPKQDYSAEKVFRAMSHRAAHFIPALPDVSNYLVSNLCPSDVLLVLSAGDADTVSKDVLEKLENLNK